MTTITAKVRRHGFWPKVREALLGTERDFTEGSIAMAITLLAIPMVLEMVMESLFAVVDVFFVAKLGSDAVAAVGLTESILTLVFAVAMGLSMATTAMVARRSGEKDAEAASVATFQSIVLGVIVAIAVGAAGIAFAPQILRLMGATPGIVATGTGFTQSVLGGSITVMLLFLINAAFRGAGDAAIAMRTLWIANGINMVLNPLLIFGIGPFPELGVTGSGIGTTIGRGCGVAYQVYMLTRGGGRLTLRREHLRIAPDVMRKLVRLSIGGTLQYLIGVASWIGLVRINAQFGAAAIAGYTLAIRVIIFALLPSWGLSNAGATLVGQNLGAGKPDRAEKSVWLAGVFNMVFLGLVGLLFIAFAEPIIRIFTGDPDVVRHATECLRIVSYGYVFYAYGMVMVQAFNGAGDTFTPSVINFFCYWMVQIPLAYALAMPLGMEASGVFWAIPVAESLLAIVGVLAFRRGTWKLQKV